MRLAIVGSTCLEGSVEARDLVRTLVFEQYVKGHDEFVVVSGSAAGIDAMAEAAARLFGVRTAIFPPEGKGWHYYRERNLRIAEHCTHLIRIVGECSVTYGSGWTRDRAAAMGKPVREFVTGRDGTIEERLLPQGRREVEAPQALELELELIDEAVTGGATPAEQP